MRRLHLLLLLAAALASACGASHGSSRAPAPPPCPAPPPPAEAPIFEFHSGFWVNLHQRLHYAATSSRPPPPDPAPARSSPAWGAAVDFYKARFGGQGAMGLIFDDGLVALNRKLGEAGSSASLPGIEPALAAQLLAAAEVVRPEWPAEDERNRAWIAALEPAVARHGAAMKAELAAAFRTPWPKEPIRVDVARFAGPFGAYTAGERVHTTISSGDPGYAGDASFEMVFHEASHALSDLLEKTLDAEAAKRGRKAPKNLWHAVIFYTAGELAKRRLGPAYVPYATRRGVWGHGWTEFEIALRREWQPYLDGSVDFEHAVGALIDALPAGEAPAPP